MQKPCLWWRAAIATAVAAVAAVAASIVAVAAAAVVEVRVISNHAA